MATVEDLVAAARSYARLKWEEQDALRAVRQRYNGTNRARHLRAIERSTQALYELGNIAMDLEGSWVARAIPCPICDGVGHRVAGTGLRSNVVRLVDCPTCSGFGRILTSSADGVAVPVSSSAGVGTTPPAVGSKSRGVTAEASSGDMPGWVKKFNEGIEAMSETDREALRARLLKGIDSVVERLVEKTVDAAFGKARGRLGDNDSKEPRT